MKKSMIKKLAVTVISALTVITMSAAAYADDIPLRGGNDGTSVNITKEMSVSNPDLLSVDGPGASYSYSIAPVEPSDDNGGTTVTDSNNNSATVHKGPQGGVTLTVSSASFPVGAALDSSAEGTVNTKYITAAATVTAFSSPGIYRYEITETADLGSAGVTDTGDRVRYLDVYVINSDDGLTVSGFTLHDKFNNKTEGFNGASAGPGEPFTGAATFETVNLTLTTEIKGNMGDKQNQFPFAGTVNDGGRYFFASKGSAPAAAEASKVSGTSVSTTLSDGEVYYLSGLSKTATVAYTETNNTEDTYKISVSGVRDIEQTAVAPNGTKEMPATTVTDAKDVTFTNTLNSVSPTGVAMRFGAPMVMLALGALLFSLNRRSDKTTGAC